MSMICSFFFYSSTIGRTGKTILCAGAASTTLVSVLAGGTFFFFFLDGPMQDKYISN